ncbi:translation initiation factor IF-2 [Fusibacter ferrireducens]|uniref:Translation initiation factor IF-2 n=1 Tax=Fusibacter ferrireducens TaxID=2785058 RepID=A0ABR9ZP57_9FIRM|nr:translation initiation factor IF-2 [Fusibacter ferrireducens]MBF4691771.1 translation initiation factor IF-2 [Fusibacter ferrireducens]
MSKIRIYELAKELNKSNKEVQDAATKLGFEIKSHMSTLEDNEVAKLRSNFKPKSASDQAQSKPAEKHHKIIYDRTKEVKEEENKKHTKNYSSDSRNRNYDNRSNDTRNRTNDTRSSNAGSSSASRTTDNRNYDNRSRTTDNRSRSYDNRSGEQRTGGYAPNRNYDNRNNDNRTSTSRPAGDRTASDNRNKNYDNRNRSYDNRPAGDRPSGDNRSYNNNRSYDNRNNPNRTGDQRTGDQRTGGYNQNRNYDNRNRSYDNKNSSGTASGNRDGGYKPREGGYKPREGGYKPREGGYKPREGGYKPREGSSNTGSSNRGSGNYQSRDGRNSSKKTESSIKSIVSEIQEKTPKKKKPKKDKIVVTFDQDKLETKAKKAKKLQKGSMAVKETDPNRNFNFGKKTKQKKVKYKQQFEKDKIEKLEEKLAKEVLKIEMPITVKEFAEKINKGINDVIMKLMELGTMATINQDLDFETAELLALEYNIELEQVVVEEENLVELFELDSEDKPEEMIKRAPVVTVMGHVDHGKTSLLDAIRDTGVAEGEAGGITQHIGASEVIHRGEKIVFLDTPGHEAFTSLRARGAKVTDIAILVVAADDGVMPQTIEAIDHSKAANVPIIVAINKIDKPNANPDRVKQELADRGVLIEEWGGDVIAVPVSAKTGEGLDKLLEMVLLVAEVLELKANPNRLGVGSVIEAKVVKGRGTVTTIILEKGQMCVGDPIVAGASAGKIKAMYNDKGKKVKKIGPSTSVEIDGLSDIPQAGDQIFVTPDEKTAKLFADRNAIQVREKSLSKNSGLTLEELFEKIQQGEIKDLNIIVKADVHGSVEAIKQSLLKIKNEEVRVNILHASVGAISESDVALASASSAIIIGFNVRPSANVSFIADQEGVSIRTYSIIYDAINDVETAMKGMLKPTFKEVVLGRIQVRATFKVPNVGTIAGGYVTTGKVTRNAQVRVIREGIVIFEGKIASLKRFKDDAKEVNTGYECGIGLEKYDDLRENDEIEAFVMEEVKRDL